MKIEFIKRGAATRLILIFAGWSTDTRYYSDCRVEGWDTAVVSDYRDMTMPSLPEQYATVYVFAYSLGVAAAAFCSFPAVVRVAICGSTQPVSDIFGIPEAVYAGTLAGLCERSLRKFHLRMAGDKATYESIEGRLPQNPDIEYLKEELAAIRALAEGPASEQSVRFDRVYIAEDDRIFSKENLLSSWKSSCDTETVVLKAPHAVDIASIVRECLPDTEAIAEGFSRAGNSYNENAVVQREICERICERLALMLPGMTTEKISLLEIGVGNGLLTGEWRKILTPDKATYVDLTEMPVFGAAREESYVKVDAEAWFEESREAFDIILSASAMQWFADPVRFVTTVRRHLNPGGFAILSTFVRGNLKELDILRPSPIIYRTAEEYGAVFGVRTEEWERKLSFSSSRDMMMHLRLTGVSPRMKKSVSAPEAKSLREARGSLTDFPRELTYRPLIVLITAEDSSR